MHLRNPPWNHIDDSIFKKKFCAKLQGRICRQESAMTNFEKTWIHSLLLFPKSILNQAVTSATTFFLNGTTGLDLSNLPKRSRWKTPQKWKRQGCWRYEIQVICIHRQVAEHSKAASHKFLR